MVLRVKEAYSFDLEGVPVVMRVGDLLDDGDPRAVGREQYLEPAEDAAARTTPASVETATAAPGERRTVTRARPK